MSYHKTGRVIFHLFSSLFCFPIEVYLCLMEASTAGSKAPTTALSWVSRGQLEKSVLNDCCLSLLYKNFCSLFCISMAELVRCCWRCYSVACLVWSDTPWKLLPAMNLQHTFLSDFSPSKHWNQPIVDSCHLYCYCLIIIFCCGKSIKWTRHLPWMLKAVNHGAWVSESLTLLALYVERLINWNPSEVISVVTWIREVVDCWSRTLQW